MKNELLAKVLNKEANIAVIGLGYVGLPLAVSLAEAGFPTWGLDVDARKVESVNLGESYIPDVASDELTPLVQRGQISAAANYDAALEADVVIICVATPFSKFKDPDISHVVAAAEEIACRVQQGVLVVLDSTTYPGTTEEVILPHLVANGYCVGEDVFVAFSPECIDPGQRDYSLRNTPKVLGGATPNCLELAKALYEQIVETLVPVSSTKAAEMVKLLENTFRAVNIALVNEATMMCDKLGIDV